MASLPFDFENRDGHRLSGRLERPVGRARAFALFAHCFTCGKSSLASSRISHALAEKGIGVLRFDFTGLGESEGNFGAGLTGDINDIVAAASAMQIADMPVQLLIGHSFGGPAVIAAAASINTVTAVAVIGAPYDVEHVLKHVGIASGEISRDCKTAVTIGGRAFELGPEFLAAINNHDLEAYIGQLRRALLVMHSPVDPVVAIENASQIFGAARHPKSFISLENADHLLLKQQDADYVASIIDAWSCRYIGIDRTRQ